MRFLLASDVHSDVADALRQLKHKPATLAEVGLTDDATPQDLMDVSRREQLELVVATPALRQDVVPAAGRLLVYLHVEPDAHADGIARLLARFKRLSPGRLYTVTPAGVKVSQLPLGNL